MDLEGDSVPARSGRVVAALVVAMVAATLVALPGLVAVGPAAGAGQQVVAGLGSLVAVAGGVKLVAVAWGLGSRLVAGMPGERAAAVVD